jgi:hypothetical protein
MTEESFIRMVVIRHAVPLHTSGLPSGWQKYLYIYYWERVMIGLSDRLGSVKKIKPPISPYA